MSPPNNQRTFTHGPPLESKVAGLPKTRGGHRPPMGPGAESAADIMCELGDDVRLLQRTAGEQTDLLRSVLKELQDSRTNAPELLKPIIEGRETLIEAIKVGNANTVIFVKLAKKLAEQHGIDLGDVERMLDEK